MSYIKWLIEKDLNELDYQIESHEESIQRCQWLKDTWVENVGKSKMFSQTDIYKDGLQEHEDRINKLKQELEEYKKEKEEIHQELKTIQI